MPLPELLERLLTTPGPSGQEQAAAAVWREAAASVGVPVDPRPVVALWPTLVPRDAVPYQVEILTV